MNGKIFPPKTPPARKKPPKSSHCTASEKSCVEYDVLSDNRFWVYQICYIFCWCTVHCYRAGFEGSTCAYDINECESSPCKNDGQCNDLINSYTCSCHLGNQLIDISSSTCKKARFNWMQNYWWLVLGKVTETDRLSLVSESPDEKQVILCVAELLVKSIPLPSPPPPPCYY